MNLPVVYVGDMYIRHAGVIANMFPQSVPFMVYFKCELCTKFIN